MKLNTLISSKDKDQFSGEFILSTINKLQETIKANVSKTEPVFLRLGHDMQQIYSDSVALTQIITDSADAIGSQTEGSLNFHIESIVIELLKELKDCEKIITENTVYMESSNSKLEQLCHICTGLNKLSRFLNIIGMNIDCESCRSVESKNLFEGFGVEVKELAHKMGIIANQVYDDAKSVESNQISGIESIRSRLVKLSTLSESAQKGVLYAMEKVEKLTQISYSTLESAAVHSEDIQRQIGDIVMALQFHDIVRQKLEHVISAFEDCNKLLSEIGSQEILDNIVKGKQQNDIPKELQKDCAKIYFILKVQAAQLNQIIIELNQVHSKLENSFSQIDSKTLSLMADVVGSSMGKRDEKELEKEFESIGKELDNLKTLRSHGEGLSAEMMESIKNTSMVISGLSQYTDKVKDININLHYKALNAIIMTYKLGSKGRTLKVLAKEVRLSSLNSNEQMEQIVEALTSIVDITGNLKGVIQNGSEQTTSSLSLSLDNILNKISDTMRRYQESKSQSVKMSKELGKSIESIRKRVDFISQWAEDIDTSNSELNTLVSQIEPLILSMDMDILVEVENLTKRYTMESERIVHNLASSISTNNQNEDEPKNQSDSHSQTDNDEFGDNIELF